MTSAPRRYSFDSSALIGIDQRPSATASAFWAALSAMAADGRAIIIGLVLDELSAKPDEVFRRTAALRGTLAFVPSSAFRTGLLAGALDEVKAEFPRMSRRRRGRERADAWIVAHARATPGTIVVTEESTRKPNKIPAACRRYGVECINLEEFLRRESLI